MLTTPPPAGDARSTASSSSRWSTRPSWPISGCASSALRAVAGSRVTAASAVRRSYAATCWTRPSSSGASGRCGSGTGTVRADAGGHLDDVVVGEAVDDAVVAHVDDVHVTGVARERGDESGRGLAVEGAAALLQQRRLLVELGIAVELEQLALDLGHRDGARCAVALLVEHLVVTVEVAEVVRRDRTELVEHAPRQLDVGGDLVTVLGEQLRQDVLTVERDRPDPGEVIETDLVDDDARRLDAEPAGEAALEADRDVAEADGAVAGVEQRAGDDADRVREVDDPGVGRGERSHAVGDLEHDRHGAQRLREASGAGRLLPDAAARERHRLVAETRLLPADADLDEHEVGAVDGAVEIVGHRQRAAVALALEHARGHRADDARRSGSMSCRTSSRTGSRSRSRERPETSSGV